MDRIINILTKDHPATRLYALIYGEDSDGDEVSVYLPEHLAIETDGQFWFESAMERMSLYQLEVVTDFNFVVGRQL